MGHQPQRHYRIRRPVLLDKDEGYKKYPTDDEQTIDDWIGPGHLLSRLQAESEKQTANRDHKGYGSHDIDSTQFLAQRLALHLIRENYVHLSRNEYETEQKDGSLLAYQLRTL